MLFRSSCTSDPSINRSCRWEPRERTGIERGPEYHGRRLTRLRALYDPKGIRRPLSREWSVTTVDRSGIERLTVHTPGLRGRAAPTSRFRCLSRGVHTAVSWVTGRRTATVDSPGIRDQEGALRSRQWEQVRVARPASPRRPGRTQFRVGLDRGRRDTEPRLEAREEY